MSIKIKTNRESGIISKAILFILFFSYIYSIHYKYMPLNSTAILGIFGIVILRPSPYVRNIILVGNSASRIIRLFVPIVLITILTLIAHMSSDLRFVKWAITGVLYFYGAVTIVSFIKRVFGRIDGVLLVDLMILSALLQMVLALAMWASPSLHDMLFSLLQTTSINDMIFEKAGEMRLMGFGAYFFGSGIIHGFILMMIAIFFNKVSGLKTFLWAFSFIVIFAIGMMLARSTIIGASLALAILLINAYKGKKITSSVYKVALALGFTLAIVSSFSPSLWNRFDVAVRFGFELFINERETGHMTVQSMNSLENMYIYPDNITTWLIGDAKWEKANGSYYMDTDVGVCRMLFYFGLLGLAAYVVFNIKLLFAIYQRNRNWGKIPMALLFALIVILNFKGFTDIFLLIIPFYFVEEENEKRFIKTRLFVNN